MGSVGYYFWLAAQAIEFPVLFPPAGLALVGGIIGCMAALPSIPSGCGRQALAAVLVPLVLPAAILLCGVLLAHDSELDALAPLWPEQLIGGLLLAHLPVGALLVWRLRGTRLLALSASVAVAGYSCGAAFMSTMSVSGRWL